MTLHLAASQSRDIVTSSSSSTLVTSSSSALPVSSSARRLESPDHDPEKWDGGRATVFRRVAASNNCRARGYKIFSFSQKSIMKEA